MVPDPDMRCSCQRSSCAGGDCFETQKTYGIYLDKLYKLTELTSTTIALPLVFSVGSKKEHILDHSEYGGSEMGRPRWMTLNHYRHFTQHQCSTLSCFRFLLPKSWVVLHTSPDLPDLSVREPLLTKVPACCGV